MQVPTGILRGIKIAYAAFEPFPNAKGSGTRMTQMVSALAEAGAHVRLFTLCGRDADIQLPPGIEHRPLEIVEPNFLRRGELFRARLLRELIAFQPHVVHFRGLFEAQAAAAFAGYSPVQRVFEVNGLFSVELGYHYPQVHGAADFQEKLNNLEADALSQADLVITQSKTTLEYLCARVPSIREQAVVIANGAIPMEQRPTSSSQPDPPRILYAGTLAPWQGVAELLMATRRISRAIPVRLVLAGPVRRSWRKQLERIASRLGLGEQVEILGPLERSALAIQMSNSDVCVAPLRHDARNIRQGCSPIKLFEYMAAGRPVVSTDLPCVREVIEPEFTGLLATCTRPSALAQPILRLLEDRELARSLGNRAREYVTRTALWEHRRAALVTTYRERLSPHWTSTAPPGS